jgi:hypothetical protein
MLISTPGSFSPYNAVPSVPDGVAVPDPVTSRLIQKG